VWACFSLLPNYTIPASCMHMYAYIQAGLPLLVERDRNLMITFPLHFLCFLYKSRANSVLYIHRILAVLYYYYSGADSRPLYRDHCVFSMDVNCYKHECIKSQRSPTTNNLHLHVHVCRPVLKSVGFSPLSTLKYPLKICIHFTMLSFW
jgi:hypothetical protein